MNRRLPRVTRTYTLLPSPVLVRPPNPPCGTAAGASSAAPGFDHAIVIGTLSRHEKNTVPRPIVRQRARRPEAAWSGEAPTAASPVSTTANELVNPTTPVTTPANTAWVVSAPAARCVMAAGYRDRSQPAYALLHPHPAGTK